PGDTVIAVMGLTGVGKSTFISHYSDRAKVGKTLKSCTTDIGIHPACIDGKMLYLVDTPGFDDKDRTDVDILRETASWLWEAYDAKVKLAGVVYLHRIQDNRVSGTIAQNIELFQELCGKNGLASVVLATTMWDISPDRATSEARERELVSEDAFWGRLVQHGCTVMRQDSGIDSATRIIRHILAQQSVTLLVQEEIAEGAKLHQTAAGVVLTTRLKEQKKMYNDKMEQLHEKLAEMQERMRRMQEELGCQNQERERERQERELEKQDREREKKAREDEKKANQDREAAWEKDNKDTTGEISRLNEEIKSIKKNQERTNTDQKKIKMGLIRRVWILIW
ncbi:P-loop containing nucleoside triphosphate hydrolase protein, partial [Lasiosphaeria hispida]